MNMKTDTLILDACCGPRMMWFDKRNPQAVIDENLLGIGKDPQWTGVKIKGSYPPIKLGVGVSR